jgi:hypothetical protein
MKINNQKFETTYLKALCIFTIVSMISIQSVLAQYSTITADKKMGMKINHPEELTPSSRKIKGINSYTAEISYENNEIHAISYVGIKSSKKNPNKIFKNRSVKAKGLNMELYLLASDFDKPFKLEKGTSYNLTPKSNAKEIYFGNCFIQMFKSKNGISKNIDNEDGFLPYDKAYLCNATLDVLDYDSELGSYSLDLKLEPYLVEASKLDVVGKKRIFRRKLENFTMEVNFLIAE